MTLKDLWRISPQNFIFIRNADGKVTEYAGGKDNADRIVKDILCTSYPNYRHVLEVKIEDI